MPGLIRCEIHGLFETELHHLAAHDVAEIVFPEAAKAGEGVYQDFEAEVAPKGQQFHFDRNFAEADGRVVAEARVILAEIAEGKTVEVPAVRGVAEGTEIRVVRRGEEDAATGLEETMEFLHRFDYVGDVFDDVDGTDFVECAVAEGVGETVEVAEDVGFAGGVAIDADGAWKFVAAAADIENFHPFYGSSGKPGGEGQRVTFGQICRQRVRKHN